LYIISLTTLIINQLIYSIIPELGLTVYVKELVKMKQTSVTLLFVHVCKTTITWSVGQQGEAWPKDI